MQLVRARGSTSDWTVWYMIAVTYMKWNSIGIVWGNTNRMGCICYITNVTMSWWRHQMETFSALLALCAGNSPVTGKFTAQRLVARSFDVFIDLPLNKRLCKQSFVNGFTFLSRVTRPTSSPNCPLHTGITNPCHSPCCLTVTVLSL